MLPKNILLVAATQAEIQPLLNEWTIKELISNGLITGEYAGCYLSVVVTGVGMVNTAYALGQIADAPFDYCINAGIGGSFDKNLALGTVVLVTADELSEMGAEDGTAFLPWEQLGLGGTTCFKMPLAALPNSLQTLPQVKGITVNTVHGNSEHIAAVNTRCHAVIESMEGAAFFRGCAHLSGTKLQLRAISNYVERRNRLAWNIPLAIEQLNRTLIRFLHE